MRCIDWIKRLLGPPTEVSTIDFSEREEKLLKAREHVLASSKEMEKASNILRELVREKGLPR